MTDILTDQLVPMIDNLPAIPWKEKVAYLTWKFLQFDQIDCPLKHEFKDGLYIRYIRIPKDSLFIGRAHRHGHQVDLTEGMVIHLTEFARHVIEAPFTMVTKPGDQVICYALSDVIGKTYHPNPTNSRDLEALEAEAFESVDSLKTLGLSVHEKVSNLCLA